MKKLIVLIMTLCVSYSAWAGCASNQYLNGNKCTACPAGAKCDGKTAKCSGRYHLVGGQYDIHWLEEFIKNRKA